MRTHLSASHLLMSALVCVIVGCTKDAEESTPPPIADYRTYDWVPVAVKEAGADGFAALCKNTPIATRTGSIQLLGTDGREGARIILDSMPTRIEDIEFRREDLLYTDFARHGGIYYIVGTGRQTELDNRLHLVVQAVGSNGAPVAEPFRRFLVSSSEVEINDEPLLSMDLDGLPRLRALCDVIDDGLVVAVRWETATAAGVRLFRFPLGGSGAKSILTDIDLDGPTDRLLQLACDPNNGRTILVTDAMEPATRIRIHGFAATPTGWTEEGAYDLVSGNERIDPQQLWFDGSVFVMTGNQLVAGTDRIRPVISRFADASSAGPGTRSIANITADARSVASYCTGSWDGSIHMMAQVHQANALVPYFDSDIISDLRMVDLNGDLDVVGEPKTIIPGQGLRAIGAFNTPEGKHVVIGSQHPFRNPGYVHTFFIELQ